MQSVDDLPPDSVLLQDRVDGISKWLLFRNPVDVVKAYCIADVASGIQAVRDHVSNGLYAAGFLSYEASSALDGALKTHDAGEFPLLWFAIFQDYEVVDSLPQPIHKESMEGEWLPSAMLGARGVGGFRGLLLGSTTHQVAHHATCPLVVIPHAGD